MRYKQPMRVLAIFFICFFVAPSAHAGAWLQQPGHGIALLQSTYFTSDEFFDQDRSLQPQESFTKYELQPYVEYGLTQHWTIGGTAYLNHVAQGSEENYGLADPELFARTHVWSTDTTVISLQPLIKFTSLYQDNSSPRGGSKSYDAELSLLYGQNLELFSQRYYVDMRAGYRWRSRGREPQLRTDMSIGTSVLENLQLITSVRYIGSQETSASFVENGEQDYQLLKTEVTALYHLSDTHWLQATGFTHVDGQMVGAGSGFSFGFGRRF